MSEEITGHMTCKLERKSSPIQNNIYLTNKDMSIEKHKQNMPLDDMQFEFVKVRGTTDVYEAATRKTIEGNEKLFQKNLKLFVYIKGQP